MINLQREQNKFEYNLITVKATKMSEWKLPYPPELTKEEKELKMKYNLLRSLKEKLKLLEKRRHDIDLLRQSSLDGTSQDQLKEAAGKILKAKEDLKNCQGRKTSGFKRSNKQNESRQVVQRKSVMSEYASEVDCIPRSVNVRGRNLESQFIFNIFRKFGDISKIKVYPDNANASLVYKNPESAQMAVLSYRTEKVIPDDVFSSVEMAKKRNTSWVDLAMKEATTTYDATNRGKNTVHVSYQGNLILQDFRIIFRSVGRVEKIYVPPLGYATSIAPEYKPRFAFVTFQDETEAKRAVHEVNGQVYNDTKLTVSLQKKSTQDYTLSSSRFEQGANNPRKLVTYDHMDD